MDYLKNCGQLFRMFLKYGCFACKIELQIVRTPTAKAGGRERKHMRTDVIQIDSNGSGTEAALAETEKAAAFRGLNVKQTLRLRLLAEEMTGMLKTIVGQTAFRYWVESEGTAFSLHLAAEARLTPAARKELLKTSTSGENAAAKGFMGRIRDIFTRMREEDEAIGLTMEYGYSYLDVTGYDASMDMSPNALLYGWSLKAYRSAVSEHKNERQEQWDELERSITAKLADEIQIFIRKNNVEMVIEKDFGKE